MTNSLLIAVGLLLCSALFNTAQTQDYTKSTAELNALRNKMGKIKTALENDVGERDREREKLREIEQQLVSLDRKQDQTNDKINAAEREIVQLNNRRDTLEQESRQLIDGMAELARATYVMGRQEYIKLLLQQQQPENVNRALVYYRYLAESRMDRVHQVNANVEEMSQLAALAQTRSDELIDLQAQLATEAEKVEQLHLQREQRVTNIQRQINKRAKEVDRLRADEKRLVKLLDALQRETQRRRDLARKQDLEQQRKEQAKTREQVQQKTRIAKTTPVPLKGGQFSQMKGRLPLPVSAPISTRFGQTNQESGMKWDGIWFSAPENAAVRAVYQGQVAYADWFRGFGLLLIIDHGDGYMSLYSHNKVLYKSLGDTVSTGEVIANVGSTGGLPKPGLYFEIRENGQPRNPLIWCKAS